ncbi:glycosyltransferase family 2 protein [Niameybacter massiliensis]|uniref:Glycosyltransferase family 2 protein n=1 Tax=Holtiella tumoricola TaxID=3018743 RepID=A0AA42DQ15_9FIRM|nr:glycosyltransferase family 2 protein [Holtiella tumoricola]MDA3733169.1 glycosyltransferase family 2 protein [Holtiella tumoricola]
MTIKDEKINYSNSEICSIIIPCYNSQETIERCINSCLNQTYKNIEVIVINDGSTDLSLEICNKIMDERVKIFTQSNGGVSVARNKGIHESQGDYLMFLDSDDALEVNCVEKMMGYKHYELVIMGYQCCNDKNILIAPRAKEIHSKAEGLNELLSKEYFQYVCVPVAKLYRTKVVKQNKITFAIGLDFGEDTCFNMEYISHINNCLISNEIVYINHTRVGGLSRRYIEKCWQTLDYISQKYEQLFFSYKDGFDYQGNLEQIIVRNLKVSIDNVVSYSNWSNFKEVVNDIRNSNKIKSVEVSKLNFKEKILIVLVNKDFKNLIYILFKIQQKI